MKKFLMVCAVSALSAGLFFPINAQDAAQPVTSPSGQTATQPDLVGQTVFNSEGSTIGTVSSVATDAQGQQAAVVDISGKKILFPVSSFTPKDGGGYTTTLSAEEIKNLPEAGGSAN
ncbi:MAG TPA: PRC-barrel domain-containing protein [Rhizomicrobium sp.]